MSLIKSECNAYTLRYEVHDIGLGQREEPEAMPHGDFSRFHAAFQSMLVVFSVILSEIAPLERGIQDSVSPFGILGRYVERKILLVQPQMVDQQRTYSHKRLIVADGIEMLFQSAHINFFLISMQKHGEVAKLA